MAEKSPYGFEINPDWRTQGGVAPNVVPQNDPAQAAQNTEMYGMDEYDPSWRAMQQSQEAPNYGWGLTTAFMRGFERLRSLPDVAQGDYEELAQHMGNLADYELDERDRQRMQELQNTEGWWDATKYYLQNPALVGQVVAESLPMMIAPIVGAVAGGIGGGAAGTAMAGPPGTAVGTIGGSMAGGALGSYATDYFASMSGFFGENGVDMTDAQALKDAFQNEDLMVAAREYSRRHGIPVAIFDGLSMGLAGRIGKPLAGLAKGATPGTARRIAGNVAGVTTEMTAQAGFGMAGEAGGQVWSEGEITDIPGVLAEGFGEVVPGAVEASVSGYLDRRNTRLGRDVPAKDSPLAALLDEVDPVVQFIEDMNRRQELGLPIPEMRINPETERLEVNTADGWRPPESVDIDPTTGEAVLRRTNAVGVDAAQELTDPETGETIVDQDILDVQLEDALQGLQMDLEGQAMVRDVAEAGVEAAQAAQGSRNVQMIELEQQRSEALGREAQRAEVQKQREIDEAYEGRVDEVVAEDTGGAAPGSMLTQGRRAIEGEPVDVAGGQPTEEGMILPEGVNPVGGRPAGTALADALRGAGIVPPDDEGPTGGGTPVRGPDTTPAELQAAEAIAGQEEARAEREAIQGEPGPISLKEGRTRKDGSTSTPAAEETNNGEQRIIKFRANWSDGRSSSSSSAPMSPAEFRNQLRDEDRDSFDDIFEDDPDAKISVTEAKIVEDMDDSRFKKGDTVVEVRVDSPDGMVMQTWVVKPEFGKAISDLVEDEGTHPDIPFPAIDEPVTPTPAVGWADERLADRTYHDGLDRLISETQAGGGITLKPSEELGVTYEGRTPSQNPAWMQGIIANEGIGRKDVIAAVEKAKAGKRLGPRQKRIVASMLDEVDQPSEYEGTSPEQETARHETDVQPEGSIIAEARKVAAPEIAMPEGATMMPIAEAEALVDPNVPLDQMEAEEGPYLDTLEKQIREEGFKQPIEITLDKDGKPAKIFDGNHRVRVAQRLGLTEVPVVYISDETGNLAITQVKRLGAKLLQDPALTTSENFKTNADAKAFIEALKTDGWTEQNDILGSVYVKDGHSISVEQNEAGDYAMSLVGAEAGAKTAAPPVADIGVKGDIFSEQANRQTDVEDITEEALPEAEAREQETDEHKAYVAMLRSTGETKESVASLKKRIVANTETMESNGFGNMGRPALVTAMRQLKAKSEKDYFDVIDDVLDNLAFLPVRRGFEDAVEAGNAENSIVAEIEVQHEAWRQEVIDTDWMQLDENEIDANNIRIDRLAEMGDPRAADLVRDADSWMHEDRISAKSSHERFKKSRKSSFYGGILEIRNRADINLDAKQLSWTVDYDSLTFKTPADKARADRILEVIEKVADTKVKTDAAGGMRTSEAYFMGAQDVHERAAKGEDFQAAGSPFYTIEIETAEDGKIEVNLYKQEGVQTVLAESAPLAAYDEIADKFTDLSAAMSQANQKPIHLDAVGPANPVLKEDGTIVQKEGPIFPPPRGSRRVLEEAKFDRENFRDETDPKGWSIPKVNRKIDFGTPRDAKATLQRMKDEVAAIGEREDNKSKVIISLFDATGTWSQPWVDAGYTVVRYDSARGDDINSIDWFQEKEALMERGYTIHGVLAAPPCTSFSNAGARWWGSQHDVESKEWVRKKYGDAAAMYFDRPLDYAESLVADVNIIVDLMDPEIYAMENPSGRIRSVTDLPLATLSFDPWHFGDPYTKRTHLWGEFNAELEIMPVVPVEGSKMHKMSSGAEKVGGERSATPDGFSYSFFLANHLPGGTPEAAAAPTETAPTGEREVRLSPSINPVKGITQARLKRISKNLAKFPEVIEQMDSRTGIKIGLDVLWVSAHDDLIRVNSVHRSGIAHSTENTTYPDQYESRKVTHVKEALIALDNKLLDKIKYGIPSETEIDAAAAEADPDNATEAQKEAGNYKKGHLTIAGLAITIENPAGTVRHGNLKLRDHYGYIKRTEGADGDQVDVFVNSKAAEDYAGDVYVVDQMTEYTDDKTRSFDEHKVMLGYNNLIDARRGYKRNFNRDWKGEGGVTKMTLAEFKTWLAEPGANSRPASESNVTEAGRKARKDLIGKQRYASGRELAGAPTEAWTRKVLAGVKGAADIPDTMPMNVAVSELLKLQEQSAAFEAGEPFADVGPVQPTLDEVKTAIAPVESAMPGAPIEVLASYKQAPKIVQERMVAEKMTQVRAVFDPQTNKIYMFADQAISANDALMTALHEKAHRGLRQAFGEKLNPLLDDIFKNANETRKDNMDAIAAKYRLDPTVLEDQRVIAEELLAHMAEHDVSDGLVNKAVAFVRKLLRDLGFTQEFNDNDIRAIIREAQNSISRATDRTANRAAGVMIEEEVVVDETGEVYIVEQNAEQILTGIDKRIEICRKLRNCL